MMLQMLEKPRCGRKRLDCGAIGNGHDTFSARNHNGSSHGTNTFYSAHGRPQATCRYITDFGGIPEHTYLLKAPWHKAAASRLMFVWMATAVVFLAGMGQNLYLHINLVS